MLKCREEDVGISPGHRQPFAVSSNLLEAPDVWAPSYADEGEALARRQGSPLTNSRRVRFLCYPFFATQVDILGMKTMKRIMPTLAHAVPYGGGGRNGHRCRARI